MKTNKTNKVSFTPGPWEIEIRDNESNKEQVSICSNDGETLAYINKYEDSVLIAAAPEMLEALGAVYCECSELYPHNKNCFMIKVESALKKTRGE